MKNTVLKLGATLLTCAMVSVVPASAVTESYNFTFYNKSDTLPVNSGLKNDSEQKYYITIEGKNLSSTNIFATRIRRAADNGAVSDHEKHTSKKESKAYNYTSTVNTKTRYLMKGKKDASSTSQDDLTVYGRVTY